MLRLHTEGTNIVDSQGRARILRGINYSTFQYKHPPSPGYEAGWFVEQWFITMKEWGQNIARIPFNPGWISDPNYLTAMDWIVDKCEQYEFYCILDCHIAPVNRETWWTMWEMLAARYARNHILFDIYNEPHNESWCPDVDWPSVAQECINRIRAITDNVILLGSRDFCKDANSIAGVTGTNIVPKLHIYLHFTGGIDTLDQFNDYLLQRGYFDITDRPVFVAEIGAYSANPKPGEVPWLDMALKRITELRWPFTVWVWNPADGAPVIERDYVTPTPAGLVLQQFLPPPGPTPESPLELLIRAALSAATGVGLILLLL